jgi:hypothetical protein
MDVADGPAPARPDGPMTASTRDPITGRFITGNQAAALHGLESGRYRRERMRMLAATLDAEAVRFLEQDLTDAGGACELSERRRSQHRYRATLDATIRKLTAALQAHGIFDGKGRLRERWIARLESLISVATRIDATLGLERRTKDLGALTIADYVSQHTPARETSDPDGDAAHENRRDSA